MNKIQGKWIQEAEKLEALADRMESQVDAKLNPAVADQRPTRRRTRILEGMRKEGVLLREIQACLYGLAEMRKDAGENISEELVGIKTKAALEIILTRDDFPLYHPYNESAIKSLRRAGVDWSNWDFVKASINAMSQRVMKERGHSPDRFVVDQAERELLTRVGSIPGFFPTPDKLIDLMFERLGVEGDGAGLRVLEPSCGAGHILVRIQERLPAARVDAVEWNFELWGVAYDKASLKTIIHNEDFLVLLRPFFGMKSDGGFDVILMNPPFENGKAVEHTVHAFDLLKPGGRLVSIIPAGVANRNDKRSGAFRDLVARNGGAWIRLPSGSFEPYTSVAAYMVYLEAEND